MKIERFEDIVAWQEARILTKRVYDLCSDGAFVKDFGLKDQIQRASVSINANISEGFDSRSRLEFVKFLGYANRSGSETQSHLYVALDQKYITERQFGETYNEAAFTKKLIGGFVRYLKEGPNRSTAALQHRSTNY